MTDRNREATIRVWQSFCLKWAALDDKTLTTEEIGEMLRAALRERREQ